MPEPQHGDSIYHPGLKDNGTKVIPETREMMPEQIAQRLFDMGFRLNAPLSLSEEEQESVQLTNVHASILTHNWYDNGDRDLARFYNFVGVPNDNPAAEQIPELLYNKTTQDYGDNSEKAQDARSLLGTRDERSFLAQQEIRKAWGSMTCYIALGQIGADPWQWVPQEMKDEIINSLSGKGADSTPDQYWKFFIEDAGLSEALLGNILNHPSRNWHDKESNIEFVSTMVSRYPAACDRLIDEIVAKVRKEGASHGYVNEFIRLLGRERIQKVLEARFPNKDTSFFAWMQYESESRGQHLEYERDGNLIVRDKNHEMTERISPPHKVFIRNFGMNSMPEFATIENIQEALSAGEQSLVHAKEEVEKLTTYLLDLRKLYERKTAPNSQIELNLDEKGKE